MRTILAASLVLLAATSAQAARHPDVRQHCRVYTVASGATAWKCWTRQSHYEGHRRVVHRAYVRAHRTAKHESWHGCGALSLVRAVSGATACVAHSAAVSIGAFVAALEATGYRIDFMGGYAHRMIAGTHHWSLHASGLAIDINQVARNRVTRRFPPGVTALAAQYGLLHGAVWRRPDTGHFEIYQPGRYARRHLNGGRA